MKTTSTGLQYFLKRYGLVPTGNREKDIAMARQFLPETWREYVNNDYTHKRTRKEQ